MIETCIKLDNQRKYYAIWFDLKDVFNSAVGLVTPILHIIQLNHN